MSWRHRPIENSRPAEPKRTRGQRAVLATAGLGALAMFAGSGAVLIAKGLLEDRPIVRIAGVDTADTLIAQVITGDTLVPLTPSGDSTPVGPATTDPQTGQPVAGSSTTTSTTLGGTSIDGGSVPVSTGPQPTNIPTTDPSAPAKPSSALNFLVAAADNHACVDPGSPWDSAADPDRPVGDRSDTIMVIRIDPTVNRVAVLSFPRDLWVRIPGRGMNKINAAYRKDQPDRLIQTLKQNFGVPVDHYIQVDFCAFKRIVEAIGGVTIPFANPIRDLKHTQLSIDAGCHHFNGDEALAYVRSRYLEQQINGKWGHRDGAPDFGRIARQQDFLTRVLSKVLDKGLLDPSVARGMLDTLLNGDITTDGLSIDDFLSFGQVLRSVNPDQIGRYQIPGVEQKISGYSAINWKQAIQSKNMQHVLKIFAGTASLENATPDEPATPTGGSTLGSTPSAVADSTPAGRSSDPRDNLQANIVPDRTVTCP